MAKPTDWKEWLERGGEKKVAWALNYLWKRADAAVHAPPRGIMGETDYAYCQRWISHLANSGLHEKLLRNMRGAWNTQHRRTKGSGKKSYSFVMSTDVGPTLRRLAKAGDVPLAEALQQIILEEETFRRKLETEYKEKLRSAEKAIADNAKRDALRPLKLANLDPHKRKAKVQKQIDKIMDILSELEEFI